jgi:Leucine-rich repeat (LRR) protein
MLTQKGIKILNVSHNQIVDIPKASFPKLFELHTIDFSNNAMTTIGRSVFSPLFSLRRLTFRQG